MLPSLQDSLDVEIALLLESVYKQYGYDFRDYSKAHIKRRILNRVNLSRLSGISELETKVLNDKAFAQELLEDLSITVTEMFRDPDFYRIVREKVLPVLKTYPFIRIWHAGCATGEEVYSMAILLQEENLLKRTTIYATDFNQKALNVAKAGIYSHQRIKSYTTNYQKSGGWEGLSKYYSADNDMVIMDKDLKKKIVWANHNLVTDSVFSSVHMIICRNVLIYFNKTLQKRVQQLFFESLVDGGFLCLSSKESLDSMGVSDKYININKKEKIFKKNYQD